MFRSRLPVTLGGLSTRDVDQHGHLPIVHTNVNDRLTHGNRPIYNAGAVIPRAGLNKLLVKWTTHTWTCRPTRSHLEHVNILHQQQFGLTPKDPCNNGKLGCSGSGSRLDDIDSQTVFALRENKTKDAVDNVVHRIVDETVPERQVDRLLWARLAKRGSSDRSSVSGNGLW